VFDRTLPNDAVFLGEVGLGGEIRPISQAERRLAEAARMGMKRVYLSDRGVPKRASREIQVVGVPTITELFQRLFA
jgi:DNA repair protein RadA/Sms